MNQREIKFKAWNKERNIMSYDLAIPDIAKEEAFVLKGKTNEYHWLQYTGLKDRNGKEIYEGDRLKYLNYILIVKWKLGGFVLEVEGNNKGEYFLFYDMSHGMLEVIGNIYEHPHMLEPAKTTEP